MIIQIQVTLDTILGDKVDFYLNFLSANTMARLPRYVIPNQSQHIIQRGNNRQATFVSEVDYLFFRDALIASAKKYGLLIHAYV